MLYPFQFEPRYKERVWGGRKLQELFGKPLPEGMPIGESWEISDRPGDSSVIANGALVGKDLHWLMKNHGLELLGYAPTGDASFPLLCKLLDARDDLSLQVHPPAKLAAALGGEPKTEMWYVAAAEPGARLYVGLKRGVSRAEFESKIKDGTVADCFHQVPVSAGDAMFLPSGRVHALGRGLVIFEIQQNSDTTYRVFDWNRRGLDGRPRQLHIGQSLRSINFEDFEPPALPRVWAPAPHGRCRELVCDPLFEADLQLFETGNPRVVPPGLCLIAATAGDLRVTSKSGGAILKVGDFCMVPACISDAEITGAPNSACLEIRLGKRAD